MENKMHRGVGRGNLRERNNLEDLRVKGMMDFTEFGWEGVEWIDLAQDWDKLWAAVHTVMNIQVL
jgi:hypothetical protein